MIVKELKARIILNSRKEKAINVIVNKQFSASTPSGASTGSHEVKAFAKDIKSSCDYINFKSKIKGMRFEEFNDLGQLDELISVIGGNAVLALQYAVLREMADNNVWSFLNPRSKRIPMPLGNVIGGGKHTKLSSTSIQEFLLIPRALAINENFAVMRDLHKKIGKAINAKAMTDEGAWIPAMPDMKALEFLRKYLSDLNNTSGVKVNFGLDMAASGLWDGKYYRYRNLDGKAAKVGRKSQIAFVNKIIKDNFLCYVEDPLEEEDFEGFSKIMKTTLVCGDDLVTTNLERLKEAIEHSSINCMIVKPNQIGSIIETKRVVDFAKANDIVTVISHRSGETMDTMIADLAVAWQIPHIKTGIYGRERECKLQRLVEIEGQIA